VIAWFSIVLPFEILDVVLDVRLPLALLLFLLFLLFLVLPSVCGKSSPAVPEEVRLPLPPFFLPPFFVCLRRRLLPSTLFCVRRRLFNRPPQKFEGDRVLASEVRSDFVEIESCG
jgi:hypothetical protein